MSTAPNFISARAREGHEDIIEHIVITLRMLLRKKLGFFIGVIWFRCENGTFCIDQRHVK